MHTENRKKIKDDSKNGNLQTVLDKKIVSSML